MNFQDEKVQSLDTLSSRLDEARRLGKTVVLSHGVFDLLHPGHLRHFAAAKKLGDVLVVTLTADSFVGKGPGRPAFDQQLRCESLAMLSSVDFVAVVDDATAVPAIRAIRPDIFLKGREYANEEDDPTGNIRIERELVEEFGGHIAFSDDLVFSSSRLINNFLPQHADDTQEWIRGLRREFGIERILEWLERVADLRVMVVGETILDVYTSCQALGKASKDPVLCMNRIESETHGGGVLAIAEHCAGLGAQVALVSAINNKELGATPLVDVRSRGVDCRFISIDPRPTIRKERFIDSNTQARVLEMYEMNDSPLTEESKLHFWSEIRQLLPTIDMTLIADYGHGLIDEVAASQLALESPWLAVNAQTNAGNLGFNSIQKYPRADFVTLNGNEIRLEARRRHVDFDQFIPQLRDAMGAQAVLVTQGASGLDLYLEDGRIERAPALAPFVRDRVGAGDAVLAITSMLMRVGAPEPIVGFLGNLVGAWAVSFLGNQRKLEIGSLKRQVVSVLK